ncbi:hypothetical protein ACFOUP_01960 [Belliella kenyensis]|uniref:GyrI-like small molecule binding domain-containing protein n=1 Tax=Belliella kenyensis TaxID=1472724 RepID=A0ABV8EHM6_9BACT|nr:hypothetical protein [Belliella kenyensis]MCH7401040.1 hypothetical protein [Belliella kenyensis]MDN3604038.1 hypothetical protein [Belliella kenyensis]
MRNRIIVGAIVGSLLTIGIILFQNLGGFNEVTFTTLDEPSIVLHGLTFEGTPQDEQIRHTFEKVGGEASKRSLPLFTLYYVEPAGKLDTMKVFVGIEAQDSIPGFETYKFTADLGIVAHVNAHRLVMPGPNKVKSKIRTHLKNQGSKEPFLYLDKIIDTESVQVIGLINQ